MSERGSFVTEYIYCDKCLEAAKSVLLGRQSGLCSSVIPSRVEGEALPIIAGKLGGSYQGEELHIMEQLIEDLQSMLCHDMRICVLAENGEQIFTLTST